MKFVRMFRLTAGVGIVIGLLVLVDTVLGIDLFAGIVNLLERSLSVEFDHFIIPAFLVLIGVSVDLWASRIKAQRRQESVRQEIAIASQRLRVLKATMRTVQDIVGNMQQGLQLFRLDYEDTWTADELKLFDELIFDTSDRLKLLGDLESTPEKQMASGPAIDYELVNCAT